QGGVGGGAATGAQPGQQHRLLQHEPVDVQCGGGVGLGQAGGGSVRPQQKPVGPGVATAVSRRQAPGLAAGNPARGNRGGSVGPAQSGGLPRPGRPPARPGRLIAPLAPPEPPFYPFRHSLNGWPSSDVFTPSTNYTRTGMGRATLAWMSV